MFVTCAIAPVSHRISTAVTGGMRDTDAVNDRGCGAGFT